MVSVGVLASGRGTNLQALLEAEREDRLGPASIDLVLSDNEDAPALERAARFDAPARFLDPAGLEREAYDARLVEALEDAGVDLAVLAGFMRVLSPRFLRAFPERTINIHPSLLPAFKGLDAQREALEAGVRVAGATTHLVTEEVDAGPIILQSAVPVHPDDTEDELSARILETEHVILPASVRLVAEGRLSVSDGRVQIKGEIDLPDARLVVPEVTS
jgi:phosphoribosylglycinamide formyltransferase-1